MREPRARGPRWGLERVEPERERFYAGRDLIQYICDIYTLSNVELAQRCGIPREQVSRWLRGETQPSLASLTKVLDALGWRLVLGLDRDDGVG